jgi:hypothetical protein
LPAPYRDRRRAPRPELSGALVDGDAAVVVPDHEHVREPDEQPALDDAGDLVERALEPGRVGDPAREAAVEDRASTSRGRRHIRP